MMRSIGNEAKYVRGYTYTTTQTGKICYSKFIYVGFYSLVTT